MALVAVLSGCVSPDRPPLGTGGAGLNVASAALAGGAPDLALNVVNAILVNNPRNVPALLVQGDAYTALGRLDEAGASYTQALAANPGSVTAQIGVGRLWLRTDPVQAQVLFLRVLQVEPHDKVALNNLGIAYDLQGNHAGAQESYRRALAVDPSLRAAEVNLALSMALSGRAPDAVQILRPLAGDPTASRRARHDLAAAMAMTGDREGASRILRVDMTPEEVERALQAYGALVP